MPTLSDARAGLVDASAPSLPPARLDQATVKEDPREKLRALRAEFAAKAQANAAQAAAQK